MKILHVEEFFIPDTGYQINLLAKYHSLSGNEVTILTTELDKIPYVQRIYVPTDIVERDLFFEKANNVKIIRIPVKKLISNRALWDRSVFNCIKNIAPDLVYLHGNDTLIVMEYLLFHLKKINLPVVTDTHMLLVASVNRFANFFRIIYKNLITPTIVKNNITVIKTVDDPYIHDYLGIPKEQSHLISFGSDTELFKIDEQNKFIMREKYKLPQDAFLVIYAGKLSKDKDGLWFANAIKDKIDENIFFIIIGNTHGEYGKEVEKIFSKSENKILRFPLQKYLDLPAFFQMSDIAVIPKASSLTFYDMQASGLPVIWENTHINKERVKYNNGLAYQKNDVVDFRKSILELLLAKKNNRLKIMAKNSRKYILDNYSYVEVADKYLNIMKQEIDKHRINGGYK